MDKERSSLNTNLTIGRLNYMALSKSLCKHVFSKKTPRNRPRAMTLFLLLLNIGYIKSCHKIKAEVVELVDTLHSECSGRKLLWVQVPSSVFI
jgi:hypothetical protein